MRLTRRSFFYGWKVPGRSNSGTRDIEIPQPPRAVDRDCEAAWERCLACETQFKGLDSEGAVCPRSFANSR